MKSIGFVLLASLILLSIIGTATAQNHPRDPGFCHGSGSRTGPSGHYCGQKIFVSNAGADSGLFPKPFQWGYRSRLQPVFCGLESHRRSSIWFPIRLMRTSCLNFNSGSCRTERCQTNRRGLQSQSRSSASQCTTEKPTTYFGR